MNKDILELLKAEVGDKPAMVLRQAIGEIAQLRQRIVSATLYAEVKAQRIEDLSQQLAQSEARAAQLQERLEAAGRVIAANREEAVAEDKRYWKALERIVLLEEKYFAAEARAEAAEAALAEGMGLSFEEYQALIAPRRVQCGQGVGYLA